MKTDFHHPKNDIITITPEIAREMLKKNTKNRPVRPGHVVAIADDLRNSRWIYNGQTVSFHKSGVLADGQHRLMAILNTGIAAECLVAYGLPNECKSTIGKASKLTSADLLHGHVSNPKQVAASASVCLSIVGLFGRKARDVSTVSDEAKKHPLLAEAVNIAKQQKAIAVSHLAPVYFAALKSGLDESWVHRFNEILKEGKNSGSCPVFALRERFTTNKSLGMTKGATGALESVRAISHAWNAWSDGKKVKRISTPTHMPEINGFSFSNILD